MSTLYVKVDDAMAILEGLKAKAPEEFRLPVVEAMVDLVGKVDIGAMSYETHNRIFQSAIDAAFKPKT